MQLDIEVANLTRHKVKKAFISKVIIEAADLYNRHLKKVSVSVVLIGEKRMGSLNKRYLGKDKATDVLSFNYNLGYNAKEGGRLKRKRAKGKKTIEGELILCPEVIKKSARENKIKFNQELAFVLAHGFLHLAGMKHSKKMYKIQDKVVKSMNNEQ